MTEQNKIIVTIDDFGGHFVHLPDGVVPMSASSCFEWLTELGYCLKKCETRFHARGISRVETWGKTDNDMTMDGLVDILECIARIQSDYAIIRGHILQKIKKYD